jgi:hypothetical protein
VLGGATLAHDTGPWHLELYGDRELVDSVPAIQRERRSDSVGASADYRFTPAFTAVVAGYHQSINDGNDRNGGILRLIYQPESWHGFGLQTRSRYVKSDFDGIGYFSPPVLEEHLLLAGYTHVTKDEKWVFSLLGGAGRQRLRDAAGDTTRNDLYSAEAKLRGWFNESWGMEGRAGCSNTGGPNNGVPDNNYRYCSATLSLLLAW